MTVSKVIVSLEEQRAINSLKRLARKWPDTLTIFGWSGSLHILKNGDEGIECSAESIHGINCDGGDPDHRTVDQFADVEYETAPAQKGGE